jgi:hypothetical protein
MNQRSFTPLIRFVTGDFCAPAILGLFLIAVLLLAGAGSVGLLHLESTPTTVGFISPVMPMMPVVTVILLNIYP